MMHHAFAPHLVFSLQWITYEVQRAASRAALDLQKCNFMCVRFMCWMGGERCVTRISCSIDSGQVGAVRRQLDAASDILPRQLQQQVSRSWLEVVVNGARLIVDCRWSVLLSMRTPTSMVKSRCARCCSCCTTELARQRYEWLAATPADACWYPKLPEANWLLLLHHHSAPTLSRRLRSRSYSWRPRW